MARSYRRKTVTRRRYSNRRRRSYKRKVSYRRTRYRRRGRGMQRLVKRSYPVRNPFGDKVFVKFRATRGGSFMVPSPAAEFVRVEGIVNDLSTTLVAMGNSPGFSWYPQLFQQYRVTGLKIRFTPILNPIDNAGATLAPQGMIAYINAGQNLAPNPSVSSLPEQRWCRYKPINSWFMGGSTKSVSLYMSVNKLAGGDRTTANDIDYTGTTITSTPWYSAVPEHLNFEFGITSLNDGNFLGPATNKLCDYMVTYTYYVTFWGRRPLIS